MRVSQGKKLGDVIRVWQNQHHTEEIDYKAITKWAISQGYYDKEPITREQQCEADLRRAVKNATWIDPQGRKVRIYGIPRIVFEDEVLTLSPVDMRITKPEMAKNVQDANFEGIGNDVRRHSIETESYNDNNPYSAQLPLYDYDFNAIAEEARMTGEYNDNYDEDDFNEDGE